MSELAVKQTAITSIDPESLIAKAIESNVPVETLERLLAMRSELKAEQAKEAFYQALSDFQSECPIIKKTKQVKNKDGSVRYSYAPLDSIIEQISPFLNKHGLSYTTDTTQKKDGFVTAIVEIHHRLGYSKLSEFDIPIDDAAFMNDAQKAASAFSFAKRYAVTNALGIMTGDMDDDAASLGAGVNPLDLYRRFAKHTKAVWDNLDSVRFIKDTFHDADISEEDRAHKVAEALDELDNDTQCDLNLAPTKGGIFTTEERDYLKSHEVAEARRTIINSKNDIEGKTNEKVPPVPEGKG